MISRLFVCMVLAKTAETGDLAGKLFGICGGAFSAGDYYLLVGSPLAFCEGLQPRLRVRPGWQPEQED